MISKHLTMVGTRVRVYSTLNSTHCCLNQILSCNLQYAYSGRALKKRSFSEKIKDSEAAPSIWDNPNDDFKKIFDNNRNWVDSKLAGNPDYFKKLSGGQTPTFLLVGCSDSRVGAQEIMGLDQGELFVHRNIANLVVTTDLNFLSVLFYSVNVLKVKEIIVLGHYACGGVRAASENKDLGLIEHWLKNIRDVQRLHADELGQITDPEKKHRRLVELNIQEQCFNLYGNSIVQQMQAKTGRPRIHGMVYDIADGKLHYLNIDFKSQVKKYRSIYAVADFRRYQPIDVRAAAKHAGTSDKGVKSMEDEKKEEQEKMTKLLFETIDIDRDGIISKEEIRLAMRQYVDSEISETDLAHAMEPILISATHDALNYQQFHEIMDSLHNAGIREKDDSDRLVVVRPSSGQGPPQPLRCTALTTIHELKAAIFTLTGLEIEKQSLYYNGKKLKNDNDTLSTIGIKDISEVELREEITPIKFQRPK